MNYSVLLLVLCGAIVAAQRWGRNPNCPNCPDPVDPIVPCGPPDCSNPANHQNHALFPHQDPNFYWQCFPHSIELGWQPIERMCACGTVFNPFVFPRQCTFPWDKSWAPICNWQDPPQLRPCDPWCPDCDGSSSVAPPPGDPVWPPNGPPNGPIVPPPIPPPIPPPDDDCVCPPPPCPPCVWWPCVPCVPPPCSCQNRLG